jgi:hypothetical protein
MAERRKELRVALLKWVEALWEDEAHAQRAAPATILDRSSGGVCLQISVPIGVGSKLTIKKGPRAIDGDRGAWCTPGAIKRIVS